MEVRPIALVRRSVTIYYMNFKIEQTYPSPPSTALSGTNTLVYAPGINSLVLYGEHRHAPEPPIAQQPKKKIAFKVDKSPPAPSTDKVSVFAIVDRKWSSVQARGKIPSPRSQFQCLYMHPCMIMYGGRANNKPLNQVYALNCESWLWKKLFSLDGPPVSDHYLFFKISEVMAGLVVEGWLWLLHIGDVKWELSSNQLPGSVWERVNLPLPEAVRSCWVLDQSSIVIVGASGSVKVDVNARKLLSELSFSLPSDSILGCCSQHYLQQPRSAFHFCHMITPNQVSSYRLLALLSVQLQPLCLPNTIPLHPPLKAYANVYTPEIPASNIYYLDVRGELGCINIEIEPPRAVMMLDSPGRGSVGRGGRGDDSCILEEDDEGESSVVVASVNSQSGLGWDQEQVTASEKMIVSDNPHLFKQTLQEAPARTVGKDRYPKLTVRAQQSKLVDQHKNTTKTQTQTNRPTLNISALQYQQSHHDAFSSYAQNQQERAMQHSQNQQSTPHSRSQSRLEQQNEVLDAQNLRLKIQNILYHETLKRKLLQTKAAMLENVIVNSVGLVHELSQYGSEGDKNRHIDRVKAIKARIEQNWTKELIYKRELEGRRLPTELHGLIAETMSKIQLNL